MKHRKQFLMIFEDTYKQKYKKYKLKCKQKYKSFDAGFTILEMLIVLSIISLIFTLTLPNIQSRLATIRTKGCESLVDVINSNIIQYELENGEIPISMEDLLETGLIKEQQMKCPNGAEIVIVDGQAEAME